MLSEDAVRLPCACACRAHPLLGSGWEPVPRSTGAPADHSGDQRPALRGEGVLAKGPVQKERRTQCPGVWPTATEFSVPSPVQDGVRGGADPEPAKV